MAAGYAPNDTIYNETAWWWDTEDAENSPYYTRMYRELKMDADRTEADIGAVIDPSANDDTVHFGTGTYFDCNQYVVRNQYMYSPRTERFKYSICARSIADKIVSYYHVYASDPITAISCCFANRWFHDDLITDLVARNQTIYDEISKSYSCDIKVRWEYNARSTMPTLYGYTTPGASPIIVTMEDVLDCIGKITLGGSECAIIWSITEIPIQKTNRTVMSFLRTNVPRVAPRRNRIYRGGEVFDEDDDN